MFYGRCVAFVIMVISLVAIAGCTSDTVSAPVLNAWYQPAARSSDYRVQKGDTLYSIAWMFGLEYRSLARVNDIAPPYALRVGQFLKMTNIPHGSTASLPEPAPGLSLARKVTSPIHSTVHHKQMQLSAPRLSAWDRSVAPRHWRWPAKGKIVAGFSSSAAGNKGLDIAGRYAEPIRAAAAGQVVYSGSGVRGYGNLIILKHSTNYLSAYAYNSRVYVKVGSIVKAGQKIALMGRNSAGRVMLHFEIRRKGRPVNPMRYLRR